MYHLPPSSEYLTFSDQTQVNQLRWCQSGGYSYSFQNPALNIDYREATLSTLIMFEALSSHEKGQVWKVSLHYYLSTMQPLDPGKLTCPHSKMTDTRFPKSRTATFFLYRHIWFIFWIVPLSIFIHGWVYSNLIGLDIPLRGHLLMYIHIWNAITHRPKVPLSPQRDARDEIFDNVPRDEHKFRNTWRIF